MPAEAGVGAGVHSHPKQMSPTVSLVLLRHTFVHVVVLYFVQSQSLDFILASIVHTTRTHSHVFVPGAVAGLRVGTGAEAVSLLTGAEVF